MIGNDHNIEVHLRRPQQQVGGKKIWTVKSCPKLINHFLEYIFTHLLRDLLIFCQKSKMA